MNWSAGRSPERKFTLRGVCRGSVTKAAVGPFEVILLAPVSQHGVGFGHAEEEFSIQQLCPQAGMEALDISFLPRRSRLDVAKANLAGFRPLLHPFGDELGAVVAPHVLRIASAADQDLLQGVQHPSGRIARRGSQLQTFPRVFIDHREDQHPATLDRHVFDKVIAPHFVWPAGPLTL